MGTYLGMGNAGAFSEAMKDDLDYYLWLNDDTIIYPETVSVLLDTSHKLSEKGETKAIVGGSTCDPETGQTTYGGVVRNNPLHPAPLIDCTKVCRELACLRKCW
jgi:GT2 family glycosyltransferase